MIILTFNGKPEVINTTRTIEIPFSEDVTGNITECGDDSTAIYS
ncbi:MAG: hypothetical protein OXD49_16995 [Candidatus Poribacteria bacterium]|nr:hypothetical protein [Candidatus Poribacteria bacterium]